MVIAEGKILPIVVPIGKLMWLFREFIILSLTMIWFEKILFNWELISIVLSENGTIFFDKIPLSSITLFTLEEPVGPVEKLILLITS